MISMQRILSSSFAALKNKRSRDRLGWILLLAAFLIGCSTLPVGTFKDEGDNLITGMLLVRGYSLYGNLFQNHWPFAYYWAAAVIGLLGKSILAARLSVWVFQIVSIAIAMKLSRFVLPLSLLSLVWSIIRHIYSGNMMLYHAFSSVSLVVIFAIVLAVLLRTVNANWKHSLTIGFFATVAILNDPLTVYAAGIALAFLLVADRKYGLMAGLFTGIGLASYIGWLLASNTLQGFVDQAILFNAQVFSKYKDTNPVRFRIILEQAIQGLEIWKPEWLNFDPFAPIPYNGSDRWLFTGFLYRFAVIIASLFLLLQRDFRAAGFLYFYACATLLNNVKGFRAAPFILLALFAASAVMTGAWWRKEQRSIVTARLHLVLGVLIWSMVIWLSLRVVVHTLTHDGDRLLAYDHPFATQEARGAAIRELACGQPDVLLAHYPGTAYDLWFTDMKPVSRFIFMFPWEAEVFLDEVISALDQDQVSAIVLIRNTAVWGHHVQDYMRPLLEYLDSNYVTISDMVWISPHLAAQCQK
jgi:hypothetical protein